ncbi:unnamed protein product [Microthlaspi erraticum]|uniref:Integrase catalytic domain-containing protein n=1 Tax=Microthlaspi erraticum TaxID=1685480 RepID=A0A6D2K138_9BRAS|nr:unnamed protein product [Microthlaspi erraticum]
MDHEDQIEHVLEGLPDDYKIIVDQLEGRDVTPSLVEVHEKLINHEAKLQAPSVTASSAPISANVATYKGQGHQKNNYQGQPRFNNRNNQTWQQQQFQPRQHQNSPRPYHNQESYAPRGYQGRCQIYGVHGHNARTCSQLPYGASSNLSAHPPPPWQPIANLAATAPANNWLLDTGASHHLTSDLNNLSLHQLYNGGEEVTIADGSRLPISHTGSTFLPTHSHFLTLNDVLYVPNLYKNLISVYRLCNANQVSVAFFPAHFQVKDLKMGVRLLQGRTKDELYEWPMSNKNTISMFSSPTPKTSLPYWHSRLGHPSLSILKTIVSQFSLPFNDASNKNSDCSHCLINKSHKLPFYTNTITSTKPLQYLYSDVWSSPIVSVDNFKYYLILVDHYTRYSWLYPLKRKSDVRNTFIAFKSLVENRFQHKIQTLYSDNGGEFVALRSFLTTHGISHLTSPPHTPEHNGVVERKHRHIDETRLTLLHQASMPKSYWTYAFSAAVYLINRLPASLLQNDSPYLKLFHQKPNYLKLRVFGSLCFPWLRPYTNHKLDDRSAACVFLGYSLTQSAYLCLNRSSGRIYTSRHVRFVESEFPFAVSPPSTSTSTSYTTSSSIPSSAPHSIVPVQTTPLISAPLPATPVPDPHHSTSPPPESNDSEISLPEMTNRISDAPPQVVSNSNLGIAGNSTGPSTSNPNPGPSTNRNLNLSPSTSRSPSPDPKPTPSPNPTPSPDPNPSPIVSPSPSSSSSDDEPPPQPQNRHPMQTRRKNNITKPNTKFSLTAIKHKPYIPTTVNQALRDENWRFAMGDEINAQIRNRSFSLVPPQPGQNVIATKWIYTLKYFPDGTFDRHKARWVARGFTQQYGIDYAETFSPVVKSITIRVVLQLAVSSGWVIKQLDVNNAFLHGTLTEEVYVTQPEGFVDKDRPHYVCRLHKALYGLKQAPRAWYQELKGFLLTLGFTNSVADTSVFAYIKGTDLVYTLVYVDDIFITGSNTTLIHRFIQELGNQFSLKDPTDLNYFLGIEATRTSKGLHLMQRKYILDLLAKTNMVDAKPVLTPLAALPRLCIHDGSPKLEKPSEYRMIVGSLQYLSFTRPDIAFAISRLSQFMHSPSKTHWQAAKRVLRYLAGTASHGIYLSADTPLNLHAYSDADWGGDTDDYISTNAHILYLGKTPIAWASKKQKGVSRSSTESEYRAVANTASEIRCVCSLLTELGVTRTHPPVIYCDNVGATYLCANPVFHSRMKHLALDYHFIRELV